MPVPVSMIVPDTRIATLLPFGGHKGFGLSMLIDALAGGLSGAGCCTSADRPMDGKTDGVFLVAVNVAVTAYVLTRSVA